MYMKQLRYRFISGIIFLIMVFQACTPETEDPAIDNCLLSKIDGIEIVFSTDGVTSKPQLTATSNVFQYDENKRPIVFKQYINSELTGYTKVTYNANGTLNKGTTYDESDKITGTQKYLYNSD